MLRLNAEEGLTVYNGVEMRSRYRSVDGSQPLPKMCCGAGETGECCFKHGLDGASKVRHRKLILGEPLERVEGVPLKNLFVDWNFKGLEYVLDAACQAVVDMKLRKRFDLVKPDRGRDDLLVAVGLIKLFIQLNYTGPAISSGSVKEKMKAFELLCKEPGTLGVFKKYLEVDGIEDDGNVNSPSLLLMAKYFLSSMETDKASWPFYLIWRFRIEFLHQRLLSRRSWTLSRNLKYYADLYVQWRKCHSMEGELEDVNASFMCEISQMLEYYYDGILSEMFILAAMESLNMKVEFTGKMGVRTKFQQKATPQPVVNVTLTSKNEDKTESLFPSLFGRVPPSQDLNDDTRLERVRLVDEEPIQKHDGIHQLALLGLMSHMKVVDETDMDRERNHALITTILDNPVSWSFRVSALMQRCRLEKQDKRAVDRAMRQSEALWKVVSQPDEIVHPVYRQYLFFGSGIPTATETKLLLGEILMSMEHWKEALAIYTELGSFEKLVVCYQMMSLRHKAEELILEKIREDGETPKLLVLLGDVTTEMSHYEKAWALSNKRCFESQIKIGNYHFRREEYADAVIYFKRVVDLAPLEYPCWVRLAWSYYRTKDYEAAYQAYLYAANLEYDNFQVWNNLANCALLLNRNEYAYRAYKEAIKCNYDDWMVWSNLLSVSTALKLQSDIINSYHRILDLKKDFSSIMILDELVNLLLSEGKPKASAKNVVAKLFGRITSLGSNPHVWLIYGRLLVSYIDCDSEDCSIESKASSFERGLQYYDKSLTLFRQNHGWEGDIASVRNVVNCLCEYRKQRQRAETELEGRSIPSLKSQDFLLKQAAKSVHEKLKKLVDSAPPNEDLNELFGKVCEEIKEPFYT